MQGSPRFQSSRSRAGLSVDVNEERTRVRVASSPHADGAALEVSVPFPSNVEIRSISGEISVADVSGPIRIGSMSGAVHAKGAPKQIEIETVSGNGNLDLSSGDLRASTVSGGVRAQCGDKPAKVPAHLPRAHPRGEK